MSTGKEQIPADGIPVSLFREILIWPLALHLKEPQDNPDGVVRAVTRAVDRITRNCPKWQKVDDPLEHIRKPDNPADEICWAAEAYAEGIYFHEFVQGFLFSAREPRPSRTTAKSKLDPAPFRLFRRTDLRELVVDFEVDRGAETEARTLTFEVERLNLYLFRTGAAVLAVEIVCRAAAGGISLADVLTFHDFFRRAYVPSAKQDRQPDERVQLTPLLVVSGVAWHEHSGAIERFRVGPTLVTKMVSGYIRTPDPRDEITRGRRFAPVFGHWRWLLQDTLPLAPVDRLDDRRWWSGEGRWHQVVDERMPTIATVAVEGRDGDAKYYFDRTRRGDLVRLCFADSFSPSAYPYDRRFLRGFEKEHAYGRFRDSGTLYLASGYAFVAYGAGGFFENVTAPIHMRRHYFQMGLLAHFELATLLAFSGRISRAVEYHDIDPEAFEDRMQTIEDEFLQFIHRFRFTGVSNHVQAQELFDLSRKHLRLDTIFEDLHTEITSATRYLGSRAAARDNRLVARLSAIATIGLVFGLSFSLLGINLLIQENWIDKNLNGVFKSVWFPLTAILGTISIVSLLAAGAVIVPSILKWAKTHMIETWREINRPPRQRLLYRRRRFRFFTSRFDVWIFVSLLLITLVFSFLTVAAYLRYYPR